MISINVWRNSTGEIIEFFLEGHAKFDVYGKDIVCAGISSLVQSALLGLLRYLKRKDVYSVASGNMRVKLVEPPDMQTQAILETMLLGIAEIDKQYNNLVSMREHRR